MLRLLAPLALTCAAPAAAQRMEAIDRVWAGHEVPFALVVTESHIYVGYYDSARQLSVASRPRGSSWWIYARLPSWVGWDSHNSIAMAVDADGRLHVAANMHNDPLVYFRTTNAGDVRTLARVPAMVNAAAERSMTYPVFLKDAAGRLIFKYRDGGSGRGREIYNRLDGGWKRLLDAPLVDGEGKRSAYFVGPVAGPDGWFHLSWVWRDTPDAATNHDLSYARSRDLVRWERSDGTLLPLPIRLGGAEVIDPVPVRRGMINNNTPIGFDAAGRAVIAFHKFDAGGNTQVFVARREAKGWRVAQASDWKGFRWDFGGMGSLDFRLRVTAPTMEGNKLRVPVVRDGKPIDLLLDGATLARVGERPGVTLADRLAARIAVPKGMQLNTIEDRSGVAIAWATLPPNRDLPREEAPEPTVLRLVLPE
ncbi:MAG: BNR repeat-containing protein [Sphingomonas sp.]|uniref:BNR repeat-containing protein n=1 Tax=Sphingomonas sp. TaxID=28214 RepID=UPI0022758662|nr:BNR repeat-containing protein [Sphingomonas sp.]MCX8476562.1 BNR repeat-containing protein [Sphingomonas sp.]